MPQYFSNTDSFVAEHERRTFDRAAALFDKGEWSDASRLWEELLQVYPNDPMLHFALGRCRHLMRSFDEAGVFYQKAISLNREFWQAYHHWGSLLLEQAEYHRAIEVFYMILQHRPDEGDTWTLLGGALSKIGEHETAIECCRHALNLNPENSAAMYNLSFAFAAQGMNADALAWMDAALGQQPDVPMFHMHRAALLLREGRYAEGWREWEWRLLKNDYRALNVRSAHGAMWKGEALEGRTLLVWCEQGLGDTIQFMRYLAPVKALGARILFECQKELLPIVRTVDGIDVLFERFAPSPEGFDYHVPLMSLPLLLGTTPGTIPAGGGYLDPAAMEAFSRRFDLPHNETVSIGLAWEGSRLNPVNHFRSCRPEAYEPLFDVPGCTFYSLQQPHAETVLPGAIKELGVQSMAEVAGAIAALDLVITIDTSIAHLAGAMGKEVWLMLSALPDWRWELERDATPWYDSMRIFRQSKIGEWHSAMAEAACALRSRVMK